MWFNTIKNNDGKGIIEKYNIFFVDLKKNKFYATIILGGDSYVY